MKTNPPLISKEKAEAFKRAGKQNQSDKMIIEFLYNQNTKKEFYLFEYDEKTGLAKGYTNTSFKKAETIDINKLQMNPDMRTLIGFKKEKVSEIKESIRYKEMSNQYVEESKVEKVYTDMEKNQKANDQLEQQKEFDSIRKNEEYEWER